MQGEIKIKRGVRRGRPYWNITRGGAFVGRVFSEAAVRATRTRLEAIAAKAAAS